jgi:uncharacterized protein (DUF302 family)
MPYHFTTSVSDSFDDAVTRVTEALKTEGFGVLTQIDVKSTLKDKLDVDFRRYRILGACNPASALRALRTEPYIGTMLPCNVVVQETESGQVEVSAIDPVASMQAVQNPELTRIAGEIRSKLQRVITGL